MPISNLFCAKTKAVAAKRERRKEARPGELLDAALDLFVAHLRGKQRVFYTSLGHWEDLQQPAFKNLLANAVKWALEK